MSIVLEDCGIAREDILNGVVNKLVDQIYEDRLLAEINDQIKAKAMVIVEERVSVVVDGLLSKPLQRTDLFGEAIGDPISIKAMLAESLLNWWTAVVDEKGQPTTYKGWGKKVTRAQYLTQKAAEEIFEGELRNEFNKLVNELRTEMRTSFSGAVADLLKSRLAQR